MEYTRELNEYLEKRLDSLWRSFGVKIQPKTFDDMFRFYSFVSVNSLAPRYYHNLFHIKDCLVALDKISGIDLVSLNLHQKEKKFSNWLYGITI